MFVGQMPQRRHSPVGAHVQLCNAVLEQIHPVLHQGPFHVTKYRDDMVSEPLYLVANRRGDALGWFARHDFIGNQRF
jgi:hypothetical protein